MKLDKALDWKGIKYKEDAMPKPVAAESKLVTRSGYKIEFGRKEH